MYRLILTLILFINTFCMKGQTIFYQDMFRGGVTAGGFSTGLGTGTGTVSLHLGVGSTIKKAFIFSYRTGLNTSQSIEINNVDYLFNSSNEITSFPFKNIYFSPIYLQCIDITNELNNIPASTFSITIPIQPGLPFEGIFAPYIYIAYENLSYSITNTSIIINEQNLMGNEYYSVNDLNPISINYPVGFSLYTDRSGPYSVPNCEVHFNGNLLGTIGGSDSVNNLWSYAGVKGHFYYQNNQLYGLDDDTPDSIMGGTDGLADVATYLLSNATSCNFRLKDIHFPNQAANATDVNLSYFLTYTTPCAIIPAVVSSDTAICQGQTVQLHASGGTKYEWKCLTDTLPYGNSVYGLSCKNCANPVFSGDSSAVYTVRVWNGDSCSVVRPVRVTVNPKPKGIFSTVQTTCGEQKGVIKMQNNPALQTFYAIAENGDTLQSNYQNIPQTGAGDYTAFFIDTNGCKSNDSIVTVGSFSNVVAGFTVTPTSGGAPLGVHITNTSQNAQNYQWSINGQNVGNPPTHFDTSGTYTVQLVAWNQHPECADTMTKTVLVFDSLIVQIPNVFSPNNDGVNDVFAIQTNLPVRIKAVILNRWGNEVFTCDKNLTAGNNAIWNGETKTHETVVDGTYFYRITFQLDDKVVDCNLQPCEVRKEGFVTVVR